MQRPNNKDRYNRPSHFKQNAQCKFMTRINEVYYLYGIVYPHTYVISIKGMNVSDSGLYTYQTSSNLIA